MPRKTFEGTALLPGLDEKAPRVRAAREKSNLRLSTPRLVALCAAAVVALVLSLYLFQRLERFLIRDARFALNGSDGYAVPPTLEFTGARHAPRGALNAVFAADSSKSVYLVPLSDRRVTLAAVDWVRSAAVARIWPNRILVKIQERTPVAFVTLGAGSFGLIDEDGVILPPARDRFELPVLSGVRASQSLADRRERVRRMRRLTNELGDLAQQISEVDVADPDNLKIVEPREGRTLTLLVGDRNFAVRYRNYLNHFADIRQHLPGAKILDLRLEDRITAVE